MIDAIWNKKPTIRIETVIVFFLTLFFGWMYWHDSTQATYQLIDYRQGAYYKALALQFEKGLLGTKDMIGGDWLHYNGWYYLYFGPLPALLWLLLKHTGITFSFTALTLIFSVINLLLFYSLLSSITFQIGIEEKKATPFRIGGFILYATGPLYFLSARYFIYETAIVFGSTFLILALIFFFKYWNSRSTSLLRLGMVLFICGFFMACVVLTRINLILAVVPMLGCILWKELRTHGIIRDIRILRSWFFISTLMLPVFLAAWGMALYNTARFDSPTEFGIQYSIIGSDHSEVADRIRQNKMTGVSYLILNTIQLAVLRPFWTQESFHIQYYNRPSWLIGPYPRLVDDEYVSSIIFSSPLVVLCLYLVWVFRKHKEARKTIIMLFLFLLSCYLYGALSMAYARRYIQDYYVFIIIMTTLAGYYFWYDGIDKKERTVQVVTIIVGILLLISTIGIAINLNCQVAFTTDMNRCLKLYNPPGTFKPLADRIVNELLAAR